MVTQTYLGLNSSFDQNDECAMMIMVVVAVTTSMLTYLSLSFSTSKLHKPLVWNLTQDVVSVIDRDEMEHNIVLSDGQSIHQP
jgi:hypothetical protein